MPAFFVDVGDGGGTEVEVVGEQDDFTFVFLVPHDDSAQFVRAFFFSLHPSQDDDFVGGDVSILGHVTLFDDFVKRVVLHVPDEVHAVFSQLRKLFVVVVHPVCRENGIGV